MAIDYNNLYDLAVKLSCTGLKEEEYRASVSRAYYCAFHFALEFCEKYDIEVTEVTGNSKEGVHKRMISTLEQCDVSDIQVKNRAKRIAQNLRKVKNERVLADYYLNTKVLQARALSQIALVKRILKF